VCRSTAPKMVRRRLVPRGHHPLTAAVGGPGRADPGQQVDVGLVLGQHGRAVGKLGDGVAQPSQDLVAVGITLGDQPGPPPAGHLADPAAQRGLAAGGRPRVDHSRPIVHALADPAAGGAAGQGEGSPAEADLTVAGRQARRCRGCCTGGSSGAPSPSRSPAGGDGGGRQAVVGQQDHDQTQAGAVRVVQQAQQVAGAACRTGRVGVHAGGRILRAAPSGRLCCRRLQRPARLLHPVRSSPTVTRRTSGHPLLSRLMTSGRRGSCPTRSC
jgi:hypothetical protein